MNGPVIQYEYTFLNVQVNELIDIIMYFLRVKLLSSLL